MESACYYQDDVYASYDQSGYVLENDSLDDFHLSIKNNLRKIGDVRDLFKDLTRSEWRQLEFEKKKSEMSALIKKNLAESQQAKMLADMKRQQNESNKQNRG
jgi:hypothetical protein